MLSFFAIRPTAIRLFVGLLAAGLWIVFLPVRGTAEENAGRKTMSLDGGWAFALDPGNVGEKERWWAADKVFADNIDVPGCWQAQGFGQPRGCMRHHYEGAAWYKKVVRLPEDWKGKSLWLTVGGAARRSTVFVNGQAVGSHDGFMTPFRFDITEAAKIGGENVVAIRVDNSGGGPVGCFNYLGNWGGIYRSVAIEATDNAWIDDVFVIPDVDRGQAKLKITLLSKEKIQPFRGTLKAEISLAGDAVKETFRADKEIAIEPGRELETEIDVLIPNAKLWFPETPNLYDAKVTLSGGGVRDERQVRFGMRKIDWTGGRLTINGRPCFLRGYGDDNVEVMTCLPPAKKEFFAERFALAKSLGFNNVRFHSNTPFEECFQAADEAGVLIQAELPAVYRDYVLPNKELLRKELVRILKAYRNHPSFFSFSFGNEFYLDDWPEAKRNEFHEVVRDFYALAKGLDPTRPILSNDGDPKLKPTDLKVGAWPNGERPYVCHEYGGYRASLPDVASKDRLTGFLAPFKGVLEQTNWLERHSLLDKYPAILKNSQLLFELSRKNYIENARKNPQLDGYNYWLMTDFPGGIEGEAWYYGVLDQFWRPKQATPESMRKFNAATVLLLDADLSERTMWADRERTYKIFASHFGVEPIHSGELSWRLASNSRTLLEGNLSDVQLDIGDVKEILPIKLGPFDLKQAEPLELTAELTSPEGTHANSWTIWAFPGVQKSMKEAVACQKQLADPLKAVEFVKPYDSAEKPQGLIASTLDEEALRYVRDGGTLLLLPKKGSLPGQADFPLFPIPMEFGSNTFPGTTIESGGAIDRFPHREFCEEQFYHLMQTGTAVDLDSLPKDLSPEIWGISVARREVIEMSHMALFFSGRLGKGKILVCTFDVLGNLNEKRPEAFGLLQVLLDYAVSDRFDPKTDLEGSLLPPGSKPAG
jgi:hypothetical protein